MSDDLLGINPPLKPETFDYINDTAMGAPYLDPLSLPMKPKVGDTVLFSFRNSQNRFVSFATEWERLDPSKISPFFNGKYTINSDGTFTYKTYFRYYSVNNQPVLMAVPPITTDPQNGVPRLFLYFMQEPEMLKATSEPVVSTLKVLVPFVNTFEYFGAIAIAPKRAVPKIYYTLDGSTPTNASSSVDCTEITQYGLLATIPINLQNYGQVQVKAIAMLQGFLTSEVISEIYGYYATTSAEVTPKASYDQVADTATNFVFFYKDGQNDYYKKLSFEFQGQTQTQSLQYQVQQGPWMNYSQAFSLTGTPFPKVNGNTGVVNIGVRALEAGKASYREGNAFTVKCINPRPVFKDNGGNYPDWKIENTIVTFIDENLFSNRSVALDTNLSEYPELEQSDYRYFEYEIQSIRGSGTSLEFGILGCTLNQAGLLTYPDNTTNSTGLTWAQGDVLRVHVDLKTGAFALAVNNGSWHDEFDIYSRQNSSSLTPKKYYWQFVLVNSADRSAYGTRLQGRFKAADLLYGIPSNAAPLALTV